MKWKTGCKFRILRSSEFWAETANSQGKVIVQPPSMEDQLHAALYPQSVPLTLRRLLTLEVGSGVLGRPL